jgi:hypothetical protein
MPRFAIKIKDRFFLWSTIVDAPISYATDKDGILSVMCREFPNQENAVREHVERADLTGCGDMYYSLDEVISGNRAGPDETELTIDEIYKAYQ